MGEYEGGRECSSRVQALLGLRAAGVDIVHPGPLGVGDVSEGETTDDDVWTGGMLDAAEAVWLFDVPVDLDGDESLAGGRDEVEEVVGLVEELFAVPSSETSITSTSASTLEGREQGGSRGQHWLLAASGGRCQGGRFW